MNSQKGFTLIELVVTLGVAAVLAGMVLAGYNRFNQRQSLISAGQNLKSILEDAKNRAAVSEVDCTICGGCTPSSSSDFAGWYVDFEKRQIYGKCGSNVFSEKSFGISENIKITPYITPPTGMLFNYSPLGISSITPNQNVSICLSENNLANTFYEINVSRDGIISGSDLSSSCP